MYRRSFFFFEFALPRPPPPISFVQFSRNSKGFSLVVSRSKEFNWTTSSERLNQLRPASFNCPIDRTIFEEDFKLTKKGAVHRQRDIVFVFLLFLMLLFYSGRGTTDSTTFPCRCDSRRAHNFYDLICKVTKKKNWYRGLQAQMFVAPITCDGLVAPLAWLHYHC